MSGEGNRYLLSADKILVRKPDKENARTQLENGTILYVRDM